MNLHSRIVVTLLLAAASARSAWAQDPTAERAARAAARQAKAEEQAARAAARQTAREAEATRTYAAARRDLDARRWEKAIEGFEKVAASGAARGDAALYWKAYAEGKLGERGRALETLAALKSAHPQSRWLSEANALEVEIRQASGQGPSPEQVADDDLQLMAIGALARTDPARAVALLENLLRRPGSPEVHRRALFVLAQTGAPEARSILTRVARGPSNPDLQVEAIRHLAALGAPDTGQILEEIYRASQDLELNKVVLGALASLGATDRLLALARSEERVELRRSAIRNLAAVDEKTAPAPLLNLYESRGDPASRREIVDALAAHERSGALVALARREKDPQLRRVILERLAGLRDDVAMDFLRELAR